MKEFVIKNQRDTLSLEKICLGTYGIDDGDKKVKENIMDEFFERYNVIDSARMYGNAKLDGSGGAEEFVGNYLKNRKLTNSVVIATKGGHPFLPDRHNDRLDEKSLRKDIEESLKFLRRDYLDIYYLHRDSGRDLFDVMRTLNNFVKEGKVRFIGASNWSVERILQANEIARREGFPEFEISQIAYSLAESTKELWKDDTLVVMNEEILGEYEKSGIPIMAFSSQGKGVFSKLRKNEFSAKTFERYGSENNLKKAKKVFEIADKYGVSDCAVTLRYLIDGEINVCPIVSASKFEQICEVFDIDKFELSKEDLEVLKK